ncbi:exo-alpha-sialidase [Actinoplanes sp. NPDC049265]|uniref:exo-alpha-sialidase n=1 Tax=Actinoplanes sp. NPDC049265 TaxID=3363902 RepID=UPI00371D8F1F
MGTALLAVACVAVVAPSTASAACTTPTTVPPAAGPPWPAGDVLAAGNTSTFKSTGSSIAWGPFAVAADTVTRTGAGPDAQSSAVTLWYSNRVDTSGAPANSVMTSANSGSTFTDAGPDPRNANYGYLGSAGPMLDGRLLSVAFIANATGLTTTSDGATFQLAGSLSNDKGKTWSPVRPTVTVTNADIPLTGRTVANIQGIRISGRPVQTTAGTIVLPVYFAMSGGPKQTHFAAVLTASSPLTADGTSDSTGWAFRTRPVNWNQDWSSNETSVVERPDGALLAVTRRAAAGDVSVLTYTVSTDQGATWSDPAAVTFADQPGCAVDGVSPQVALLPNGHLVLSSGRPDNWIALSTDASGTNWRQEQMTYRNRPGSGGLFWYGSSGYTSLVPTGSNSLLQLMDNCKAPAGTTAKDGCVTGSGYDHGQNYALISRGVSALTPDLGKIDLATKIKRGTVRLTTDLTGAAPPAAVSPPTPYGSAPSAADATRTDYWSRAEGATDGSTAYWSSALSSRADGTGTYQLDLDRTYHLTKLGLALRPGVAATAHLSTSADGTTWTDAPVTIATGGDRAMRYYAFDATARHVRVTADATTCPGGTPCSMINELELYSTVNSFENEATIPRGLTGLACVRMTQPAGNGDPAHDSRFAVRLNDGNDPVYCDGAKTQGRFTYSGAPAAQRTFEAGVYPVAISNALLFDVNGTRAADGTTGPAYRFGIGADRHWTVHTEAGWRTLTDTPAVPLTAWTRLRVTASPATATLATVDADGEATFVATLPREAGGAFSALTGYTVASNGTPTVGDQAVFDDIAFE